ncbi:MAG: enoyl-CoA hydratase/isomerase family protein [Actinobacteria bacterium]|nr:enoyl-CoA hydratase/isomerase family protein [Actinomycetota bacterium]
MAETETFVTAERRDDGVAVIRLDRPKMNAISGDVLNQLHDILKELESDPPGAIVVWGGERIFAAGADISQFGGASGGDISVGFRQTLDELAAFPRAVIAAINGYALGGGCEVALACDFRVMGEGAKIGLPEIQLGIIPGGGGTQRLPRVVGPARAKEMMMTGRHVKPEEALSIGLADRVVADDKVLEEACSWGAELGRGAVIAQGLVKRAVNEGLERPLDKGLDLEAECFVKAFRTEDAKIGIKSFMEQGPGKAKFIGK